MNLLHQNQTDFLGSFKLLIDDSADALTLATAGATHQSVTLPTPAAGKHNILVWITRGTAGESGPYEFDGTGFVRTTIQEILNPYNAGAPVHGGAILEGSEFQVEFGDFANKRYRVVSRGELTDYGVWINRVGIDPFVLVEADKKKETISLEAGVDADLVGAVDGVNATYTVNAATFEAVDLISVTRNGNTQDLDFAGTEGVTASHYTWNPATAAITFYVAPQTGDSITFSGLACKLI